MMELANHKEKTIFIGFMDYEKTFDYIKRADIVKDLIKGSGKRFVNSVACMYDENHYIPKVNKRAYGDCIITEYCVTQGRKTSANFFSMNISKMASTVNVATTFLENINLS